MRRFPPTRYIPKGALKVADKLSDAVAYLYTNKGGKPVAVLYIGKQSTPTSHFRYADEARRAASVTQAFKDRRAQLELKASYRAETKAWVCDYKVGEILSTCWGYDQTNREYYEVLEVRGKHVIIRELAQERTQDGFMSGKCIPLPGEYLERAKPMRKLAQRDGVRISSCQWASREKPEIVGGVPVYRTGYWSSYA